MLKDEKEEMLSDDGLTGFNDRDISFGDSTQVEGNEQIKSKA
jgi:hypothetical protein